MKSDKPAIVMCCQCTRRQNLVEHEGKNYCKFHDPLDRLGAQAEDAVAVARARAAMAGIMAMTAAVMPPRRQS